MSRSLNHGFENKCSEETFNDIYNMAFARGKERGFDDGYNKAIDNFFDKLQEYEAEDNWLRLKMSSVYAITEELRWCNKC